MVPIITELILLSLRKNFKTHRNRSSKDPQLVPILKTFVNLRRLVFCTAIEDVESFFQDIRRILRWSISMGFEIFS